MVVIYHDDKLVTLKDSFHTLNHHTVVAGPGHGGQPQDDQNLLVAVLSPLLTISDRHCCPGLTWCTGRPGVYILPRVLPSVILNSVEQCVSVRIVDEGVPS